MKRRKVIIGSIIVAVLVVGWYLLRPELLFVDKTVDEEFPVATTSSTGGPVTLSSGDFTSLAHETKGTATIYQLPDGKRTLRLTNFETSNGPDVRVYLVAAPEATDNDTVMNAGFIDLGSMKGNKGDQNYDLPADVDLDKHPRSASGAPALASTLAPHP
jgi:hypothetical protein